MSAKASIDGVFSPDVAKSLWTANTLQVYPATLQGFSVGSVLPVVLYMFRRGYRRGRGRFQEEFGLPKIRASVRFVSGKLTQDAEHFAGFEQEVAKDILGDLLLCDALENKKHAEGHLEEIQRAYPVHFFSSWLDLPAAVAHLRFVPEMLVALLANQPEGTKLTPSNEPPFAVAGDPKNSILLRIFGQGVRFGENAAVLSGDTGDTVIADAEFSIEEWLMVRLGLACGQAPEKLRQTRDGMPEIQNMRPLATDAAEAFRQDLSGFLSSFGETIPRRALTPMLEALIGLGCWHSFLSSLRAISAWDQTGLVPTTGNQNPFPLLVDASSGTDMVLRELAEQSAFEILRFLDEATVALAVVRVLDATCRDTPALEAFLPNGPRRDGWLNILGQIRKGNHDESPFVRRELSTKCKQLAARLEADAVAGEAVAILRGSTINSDPARALAESICAMMGEKALKTSYLKFLDSAAMANEPHGLLRKRTVQRTLANGKKKRMEARSVILSNTLLETLVHIHLVARGARLSFRDFITILRDRYGLWVDEAPPGLTAARADLLRNRAILERRLRDLGLLTGVNDAESMKRLRPRYRMNKETSSSAA